MRHLDLSNSDKTTFVDDEDFERLNNYKWCDNNGSIYRSFWMDGRIRHRSLPQEILCRPSVMFDHIDKNYYNNQKYNLREATYSQNNHNKGKQFFNGRCLESFYKGVSRKRHKWRARIHKNEVEYYLGVFKTQEEAAKAYDKKALDLYGSYADLNFPK